MKKQHSSHQQTKLRKGPYNNKKQPSVTQPAVRDYVTKQPAVPLTELVAQARAPLEDLLYKKETRSKVTKGITVFFSFTNALKRATVVQFSANNLDGVWKKFADWQKRQFASSPHTRWLRIDWVTDTRPMTWEECLKEIQSVKRNYFRYGISLDTKYRYAFLEQEINANAMLYLGAKSPKAGFNKKNFLSYGKKRYGKHFQLPEGSDQQVALFTTQAILVQSDKPYELLHGYSGGKEGRNTGRRMIEKLEPTQVKSLIKHSSQFLTDQVSSEGRFVYGIHPCFDREIKTYNTLRHASTTYSMLEAWEVTQCDELKSAIDRSLNYLTNQLIRLYEQPNGDVLAYLQDANNEIKLGGNAVCLLALAKYTELTKDSTYLPLLEKLALGIQRMQNSETGQFNHVLHADDLSVKEEFRIIYYDGEAAFGLMRLYGITKDERWLQTVEKAFDYFIEKEHWKIHDHWLSYCVNELTLYRPEERYYQFGIKNVAGHLDFVIGRITTFPTLLELMMAAHKMIARLQQSDEHRHLLEQIDLKKFYRALETRAHYLLNGFFWPEFAMYFQNPQRIVGSFFIRHHSFRVRIDDVEHYLSGYVAYLNHYLTEPYAPQSKLPPIKTESTAARLTGKKVSAEPVCMRQLFDSFDYRHANNYPRETFTGSQVIRSALSELGYQFSQLGVYTFAEKDKKKIVFDNTVTSFTGVIAARLAGNKKLTRSLLSEAGIRVAEGSCFSKGGKKQALAFCENYESVVVKPVNGKQSKGLSVGVKPETFDAAWTLACKNTRGDILIEENFIDGYEARYTLVGGRCVGVLFKIPPSIIGDGYSSVSTLIDGANRARLSNPHLKKMPILLNEYKLNRLKLMGLTPDSALPSGKKIYVDQYVGLSGGAWTYEASHLVHPGFIEIAETCAQSIPGIDLAGVDIMAKNHLAPPSDDNYIVIEVNTRPGIGGHHYPAFGKPNPVARDIAKFLDQMVKQ